MSQQAARNPGHTAFNRSCDACRTHKVRCLPNNSPSSKICQRCAMTDRRCVFTAPQKRKQRKTVDTRVAELAKEVQALRALVDSRDGFQRKGPENVQESWRDGRAAANTVAMSSSDSMVSPGTPNAGVSSSSAGSYTQLSSALMLQTMDVVDREVVPMDLATRLFDTFVRDLATCCPVVVFPPSCSAEELRRAKPTLFLAVIAAASAKSDPSLYSILHSEVLAAYTHRAVFESEKSLELVQAMIVTAVWYFPPGKFAQMKFYEYIHMAAAMAMDIGIGTSPKTSKDRRGPESNDDHSPQLDECLVSDEVDIERKRTFLACYLTTTGVSVSMRRPNMLRFNRRMGECMDVLWRSPSALPSDKCIVAWVKLLKISEEIGTSFSLDDPSNRVRLSESRVQLRHKGFEKRLEGWKKQFGSDGVHDSLLLAYYHVNVYLHEIALHDEHPPEDFIPPFGLDKITSASTENSATPPEIDAIAACISSSHSLLDVLLNMDVETLRALPVFIYVRVVYTAVVLTKLYMSARSPQSQIGAILDKDNLKVDIYLRSLTVRLNEAVGPMECRSPHTFLGLLLRLYSWFKNKESQDDFPRPTELLPPNQSPSPPSADILHARRDSGALLDCSNDHIAPSSQTSVDGQPSRPSLPYHLEEMDLNNAPEETGMTSQTESQVTPANDSQFVNSQMDADMDRSLLFDQIDSFGGEFGDWMPNIDMPGVLEGEPMTDMCNWGIGQ